MYKMSGVGNLSGGGEMFVNRAGVCGRTPSRSLLIAVQEICHLQWFITRRARPGGRLA